MLLDAIVAQPHFETAFQTALSATPVTIYHAKALGHSRLGGPSRETITRHGKRIGWINMITVGMNYHVLEGKQSDFEEKFSAVIAALRAAPGHTNSTLWKDVSDSASYLITSEWSDEQAFQEFIRSDAFRAVTNWGKEQILSGRPQHKVYKH